MLSPEQFGAKKKTGVIVQTWLHPCGVYSYLQVQDCDGNQQTLLVSTLLKEKRKWDSGSRITWYIWWSFLMNFILTDVRVVPYTYSQKEQLPQHLGR